MNRITYWSITVLSLAGCTSKIADSPIQQEAVAERNADSSESEVNNFQFDVYKNTPKPNREATEWSESSLLNWSTFTMEFPDNDHVADQFAEAFAARKCRLTIAVAPTVRELAEKWLREHPGKDDLIVKRHGLEIAVGGYREEGLIRMKLAFTKAIGDTASE